jgi:beta-1,4-mannosyl-glycoprotein beta-1,4-N-acetylglucosaminyltransferase
MDICENDDNIIFSDCDEIPYLKNFVFSEDSFLLSQKNMIYYFNYENKTEKWFGTYITKFSNLINGSIHDTRNIRGSFKIVENAGWHFTWFGGKDKMTEKLISYGHQEYNNQQKKDNITNFESPTNDILSRNINIEKINLSEYYPTEILEIINNKFKHLIFEN